MAQEMPKIVASEEGYHIPPYFDRYQEEREKRYQSELHRVEEGVRGNGERIGYLSEDMDRRFTELKEDMNRRFGELNRRFDQQGAWIKFTFGILSTGMVAILVKLFVG